MTKRGLQGFTLQDLQTLQHFFEASGDLQILRVFHEISMDPMEVHVMKLCNSEAFTTGDYPRLKRPVSPQNLNAKGSAQEGTASCIDGHCQILLMRQLPGTRLQILSVLEPIFAPSSNFTIWCGKGSVNPGKGDIISPKVAYTSIRLLPIEVHVMKLCNSEAFTTGASPRLKRDCPKT